MNAPAISALRDELAQIARRLDAIEKQPAFPITITPPNLKDGEKFVGILISADGTRREKLILLPGSRRGSQPELIEWAASIGGKLPDRVQGALLFSMKQSGHLEGEFEDEAYWTCEQHAGSSDCAWCQYFVYGTQDSISKDAKFLGRAVRSEPIE